MVDTLKEQSISRKKILENIKKAEKEVYSKKSQIRGAKRKTKFPGVRIQDQFSVGRLGIKPFRLEKKLQRKKAFSDIGLFNEELIGLNMGLIGARKSLADFDSIKIST